MVEADVVCVPCGEGTYSPLGIYCLTCLAGSYTADQINCNPCDAGTFSATDGATSCTACPPGWHQSASGQLECERCEVSEPHKRREAEIWLARDHVAQIEAGLKKQAENAKGTDLEKKEQEKLDRFMSKKEQDIEDDWSQPTKTAHQKKIDILQEIATSIATSEGGTKREIRATRWAWLRSQAKAEADKLEKTIRETPTVKEIDQKIKDIGYPNDLVLDEGARVSVKASDKRKAGEGTIVSVNADGTFVNGTGHTGPSEFCATSI